MAVRLRTGKVGREPSRMLRILSQRRDRRKAAERIYAVSMEAARHPTLFRDYGLPDTLQGRFESLTLHLFAVLHRLMHDPGDDPALARLISESLVTHMDATFREMGVGDTIVPKRMTALYQSFAGRIDAYTRAWEEGDEALAAAIGRNVFPDGGKKADATVLCAYLKAAVAAVRKVPLDELRSGARPFPEPPPSGTRERHG